MNRLTNLLTQIFKEENINHDFNINNDRIEIEVIDGDWKHDHAHLKNVMKKHGFIFISREITKENGDDSFSAIYIYMEEV